jgi:pSer/pThr/pTyr-binding forkhead associated (FHA) protein
MSATPKQPVFLRILKDGKPLEMKQYSGQQIVIGREGTVDLAVGEPSVSPIHAMIEEREEGKYFLCDLGSQSGTFLNGHKIVDEPITSGAEFRLGDVTLEFHIGIPRPKKTVQPIADVQAVASTPAPSPVTMPMPIKPAPQAPVIKPLTPPRPIVTPTPAQTPFAASTPTPAPVTPPPQKVEMKAEGTKVKIPPQPIKKSAPTQTISASTSSASLMGSDIIPSHKIRPAPIAGTFAKPSSARLDKMTESSRGNTVEILLVWQDRVLNTFHFNQKGIVKIGSHPNNEIILPVFGSVRIAHPLIKIDGSATIFLTADMTGEITRNNQTFLIDELKRKGEIANSGAGFSYTLHQGEVVKISMGEGVQLYIRYVAQAPESRILPFLNVPVNHLTSLVVGLMAVTLFLFYAFLYAPPPPDKVEDQVDPPRRAQFVYKRRAEELNAERDAKASSNQTIKDKELANERGEEGGAQEAKPNESKSQKQKLTSNKASKDNAIQKSKGKSAGAKPVAVAKDVNKSGMLSVFGTKGVQDQLNKAFQGSGNVAGLSQSATGQGAESAGGSKAGTGLREVGQGGQGTATVGIAGPKTKGRGGGISGYGTGSLGAKKNASIIAGGDDETFSGSIDKEAIRRVVQANLRQIRSCYERGLNKEPGLYGKIVIQWTIGAGGNVLEAGIKSSSMQNSEVESCAVARLKSWKFPEPPANEVAVVSYPFVFQAQD